MCTVSADEDAANLIGISMKNRSGINAEFDRKYALMFDRKVDATNREPDGRLDSESLLNS